LEEGAVLVDVGGGIGHLSLTIAKRYPKLRVVIQDLPHTVDEAKDVGDIRPALPLVDNVPSTGQKTMWNMLKGEWLNFKVSLAFPMPTLMLNLSPRKGTIFSPPSP
jgi:hypothetical protein